MGQPLPQRWLLAQCRSRASSPGLLTRWLKDGIRVAAEKALAHAEYYERALLNAVLGTQRGTLPGQMLVLIANGCNPGLSFLC